MGLNCGIVGLPNVGKSTLFSALTSAPAEAANYPFCTIDPNIGMVSVPDKRLDTITDLIPTKKVVPAVCEFVDIAGLVKGASKGEGLGNRFLSNIRQVDALLHVVRCFENDDITHVSNVINPVDDIEVINIELALADLEAVLKRKEKNTKLLRSASKEAGKEAKALEPILEKLEEALSQGQAARSLDWSDDELKTLKSLQLITMKRVLYVCNVDEEGLDGTNDFVKAVRTIAENEGAGFLCVCGQLEADIAALEDDDEKAAFLEEAGLEESGLDKLIHTSYDMLGLKTFFTAGETENRAWTFKEGMKAPQTAGVIHTDFEKGFIKAEVYHCDDLSQYKTEAAVKTAGKLRIEGKEYLVKDGDIMHFRFNV